MDNMDVEENYHPCLRIEFLQYVQHIIYIRQHVNFVTIIVTMNINYLTIYRF